LGEIRLGEMGLGEMGLGEMGQNLLVIRTTSRATLNDPNGNCCVQSGSVALAYRSTSGPRRLWTKAGLVSAF